MVFTLESALHEHANGCRKTSVSSSAHSSSSRARLHKTRACEGYKIYILKRVMDKCTHLIYLMNSMHQIAQQIKNSVLMLYLRCYCSKFYFPRFVLISNNPNHIGQILNSLVFFRSALPTRFVHNPFTFALLSRRYVHRIRPRAGQLTASRRTEYYVGCFC